MQKELYYEPRTNNEKLDLLCAKVDAVANSLNWCATEIWEEPTPIQIVWNRYELVKTVEADAAFFCRVSGKKILSVPLYFFKKDEWKQDALAAIWFRLNRLSGSSYVTDYRVNIKRSAWQIFLELAKSDAARNFIKLEALAPTPKEQYTT